MSFFTWRGQRPHRDTAANKVAQRTPVNQDKEFVFRRRPCHRHRRVTNRGWCNIFVAFSHHMSSEFLLAGPHRRRSHGVIFKLKKRGHTTFFVLRPHLQNAFLDVENSFIKRRAEAKKSCFFKQGIFCRCKGKTGECLPKIKRCWRFWIAEDGLSKCKACSNQSLGWRIFCAFPAGYCWQLGQALAYIRPLQMDLDTSVGESAEQPEQVCVSNCSN